MNNEIPMEISKYLKENKLELVKFKNIPSIQEVKAAYLKKADTIRGKDFSFNFNEDMKYYFFITKSLNPIYLQENPKEQLGFFPFKPNNKSEKKIEINMNFDYDKYTLQGIVAKKSSNKETDLEIYFSVILNRENCSCSNSTSDGLRYYKLTKALKPEKIKPKYDQFILSLDRYYMLEIETKKSIVDTNIKEDGILSVLYLITTEKWQIRNLFTMVKYSMYFIKETLCNYIGKYLRDLIHEFTHLPSDILSDFLSHIGALCQKEIGKKTKIIFPLKKYIDILKALHYKNLIKQMYRNLSDIIRPKAKDRIPFHKFIQMFEKYIMYYAENEFKIKESLLTGEKKNSYKFLNSSVIHEGNDSKIKKEHKLNLKNSLTFFFLTLNDFFKEKMEDYSEETSNIFMLECINKFITQYTSYKGFFNIDIVINEDAMFDFQLCSNKETNKKCNQKLFSCISTTINGINKIFDFNEGFYHKHFSILDYSYNFNEKNVIHTFPVSFDSSKKNKIKIFDIPLTEKWKYHIASLILMVYRDSFGFMNEHIEKKRQEEGYFAEIQNKFFKNFKYVHDLICDELFKNYEKVLPEYYLFCSRISKYPLDKYNCLDNLCQHFTNNSIQCLTRNNVTFFFPYDVLYKINARYLYNKPNLTHIIEPYIFLVDGNLIKFLAEKENKKEYLEKQGIDSKAYFELLKQINQEKVHYSVFISKNSDNGNDIFDCKKFEKNLEKLISPRIEQENYNFYYLSNLSYYFIYLSIQEMKGEFKDYDIVKRFIASTESSVTISFHDYDKTILQQSNKDLQSIKQAKKEKKKNIKKNLIILTKIQNMVKHMSLIFFNYVKGVIKDINNEQKSTHIKPKMVDGNRYIKIGHYLVNLDLYVNCEENKYEHLQEFIKSKFYKDIFKNEEKNSINNALIIPYDN